jgi:MOSC domain-containing protein YiiM
MLAKVVAVHLKASHAFSKEAQTSIVLTEGHGVVGDAHFGVTVKHRSRVARDPTQPNLRQVHLLQTELLDELAAAGLAVLPGQMGENFTTTGLALLEMSTGTRIRLGKTAIIEITGLRNPCSQIENFRPGLLAAVLGRSPQGELIRKAGVMGIVLAGGTVHPGDEMIVVLEPEEFSPLLPV